MEILEEKILDNDKIESSYVNLLENCDEVSVEEYMETYKSRITQESEVLFVRDFLFSILGTKKMKYVVPQYPFLDSSGRSRRIDFGVLYNSKKLALEVNGESYHAEGIIPGEQFDDNLNRQNEILSAGWFLLRFSYNQLKDPRWRQKVSHDLFSLLRRHIPEILSEETIKPNYLQEQVLGALDCYRKNGHKKGVVILPTGTGKTYLSAFDTLNAQGRILFIVHKLDILSQSRESYEKIYTTAKLGLLTGDAREHVNDSKVLFASKDTLRNCFTDFKPNEFDYIVIDEVHHGQAPTYQSILSYFKPNIFMLGLTATPDRTDRKDIFQLFDYNKVFEYTLNDAIDNGFLVPYTYYGLTDNIDYSNIRYNGSKYKIEDLDRALIIPERNERIFDEYITKGCGNKALGFCCSIKHANEMAELFKSKGIPAVAITSETPDRDKVIKDFRQSVYTVAFTVDLFNEGIDFPDLRVLLFLRPTESKTIFTQQLGRGLRLCGGKGNVVVIDFIGNYKKANLIRRILSQGKYTEKKNAQGRVEKIEYQYSPKCKVYFDAEVEQILDNQDKADRVITREDLIAAYWDLTEKLKRRPSIEDVNNEGEFKVARYVAEFGTWVKFLKEIGELTESSYHFPQGTHLGHLMYILKVVGDNSIENSRIAPEYVRFEKTENDKEPITIFQRQTKYKLQAAMELGLLVDFRSDASAGVKIILTPDGMNLYNVLRPLLNEIDMTFKEGGKAGISWAMKNEGTINETLGSFLNENPAAKALMSGLFLKTDAISLLLRYLYGVARSSQLSKNKVYTEFFACPFVTRYCEIKGIEVPTEEGARHRIPFLFNILETFGIIEQSRSGITVKYFFPTYDLIKFEEREDQSVVEQRITDLMKGTLSNDDMFMLRENFGAEFGSKDYFLPIHR
jgi:superfamily II DNA or RNA helicase